MGTNCVPEFEGLNALGDLCNKLRTGVLYEGRTALEDMGTNFARRYWDELRAGIWVTNCTRGYGNELYAGIGGTNCARGIWGKFLCGDMKINCERGYALLLRERRISLCAITPALVAPLLSPHIAHTRAYLSATSARSANFPAAVKFTHAYTTIFSIPFHLLTFANRSWRRITCVLCRRAECRQLVRMCEQRRQEALGAAARARCGGGAAHALDALARRLRALTAAVLRAYSLPPHAAQPTLYHNMAFRYIHSKAGDCDCCLQPNG